MYFQERQPRIHFQGGDDAEDHILFFSQKSSLRRSKEQWLWSLIDQAATSGSNCLLVSTSGKMFEISEPQFPLQRSGGNNAHIENLQVEGGLTSVSSSPWGKTWRGKWDGLVESLAVWLTGSSCSGQVSGLCFWGGRVEFKTLLHQRPPSST